MPFLCCTMAKSGDKCNNDGDGDGKGDGDSDDDG